MSFVSTCKIQHVSCQENIEYISCYHYHIIPLWDRNGDSVAGMTWDPDKIICRDILYHAAPYYASAEIMLRFTAVWLYTLRLPAFPLHSRWIVQFLGNRL